MQFGFSAAIVFPKILISCPVQRQADPNSPPLVIYQAERLAARHSSVTDEIFLKPKPRSPVSHLGDYAQMGYNNMLDLKTLTIVGCSALLLALTTASPGFSKAHNQGVKEIVQGDPGVTSPGLVTSPDDFDAMLGEEGKADRNGINYTTTIGNPGRSEELGLPGLKR